MIGTMNLIQSLPILSSYHSWEPYGEPNGLLDAVCLDRMIMHTYFQQNAWEVNS